FAERVMHKLDGCFQSPVQKDRAGDSFENVSQQSMLTPPAALLFSATEANELSQLQSNRSFRERRRAHQPVLHAGQLAFRRVWISSEEIVRDDYPENRIAKKFKRFV